MWACLLAIVLGVGVMLGVLGNVRHSNTLLQGKDTKSIASYCLASFKIMVYQSMYGSIRPGTILGCRLMRLLLLSKASIRDYNSDDGVTYIYKHLCHPSQYPIYLVTAWMSCVCVCVCR